VTDAQHVGGGASIGGVFDGATALVVAGRLGVLFGPQAHGDTDHLVPLLDEETGGHGGVDASGHCDDCALLGHDCSHVILNPPNPGRNQLSGAHLQAEQLAHRITDILSEKQAEDILLLDISNVSSFADYFVIASADSDRQIDAILETIDEDLRKAEKIRPRGREGTSKTGWVLLDYGDVIVHIFGTEERSFYDLESLWANAVPVVRIQ
jgi:ribosome-associated protein